MNAPCQHPRTLEKDPQQDWKRVEEPGFTEADAKMLEEAEGVFRDLASQMRAIAQNEILAVWIVKLLRYDPVMASAGLIGMSNSLATYGRCGRQHRGSVLWRWCWHQRNTLNCSRAVLEWQFKLNKQEDRHVEGSKRK